jgi:alkylation response protein AidB-like acyl-CoA dehydrogenase
MVLSTDVPARAELVARAAGLGPVLRAHTGWAEENRRVHDEVIEALAGAGMFRLRIPVRYGGFEVDTATLVEIGTELGRADGSVAWVTAVYTIPAWMAALFGDEAQDEVFTTPDVRICGTLSPSAMAAPAPGGGIVVNGKWGFISGALHAHWQEIIAILVPAGGGEPYPVMALAPMSDLLIVDDWHTYGLRGTGSVSTVAQDLHIPAHRVLPLPQILDGHTASAATTGPIYHAPLLPIASASSAGPVVGMAHAAKDAFLKRLPDRKITYTAYDNQAQAPITHHQIATAALATDQAAFHAHRLATLVDTKTTGPAAGATWTLHERATARADLGATCQLAKTAADTLAAASGGSSIYTGIPIQRITRDLHAVTLHALMHPTTNTELYGRILCGLPPNTLYI